MMSLPTLLVSIKNYMPQLPINTRSPYLSTCDVLEGKTRNSSGRFASSCSFRIVLSPEIENYLILSLQFDKHRN